MKADEIAQEALEKFLALTEKPSVVWLHHHNEWSWGNAIEKWGTLDEANEANQLLEKALRKRHVDVKWLVPDQKIEAAFFVKSDAVSWAALVKWRPENIYDKIDPTEIPF